MQETMLEKPSTKEAEKNLQAYFQSHDVQYLHEDAVFTNMGTGDESRGREAIGGMLHYIYSVAFSARADIRSTIITADKAFVEGYFRGTHINDFAGIPATNKEVNIPLCVVYDHEDGFIKKARIYMPGEVLIKQLQG